MERRLVDVSEEQAIGEGEERIDQGDDRQKENTVPILGPFYVVNMILQDV